MRLVQRRWFLAWGSLGNGRADRQTENEQERQWDGFHDFNLIQNGGLVAGADAWSGATQLSRFLTITE